jgi:type IV pilus assembly protein PilE
MNTKSRGITLIELVVVTAIVAVLAAIAVPSYRAYLLRSRRAEAKAELLSLAAAQEKFYLQNNTYAGNGVLTTAPPAGLGRRANSEGGYYTIAIAAGANAAQFSATATATGGQADDTHCASFSINQAGTKGATNADCW